MQQHYLREILLSPVYQAAVETPLQAMPKLSKRLGCQVELKREDHQPVYSFKLRGAFHKLHKVAAKATAAGTLDSTRVICASAGNHAQGVALSASKLGLHATIVMPITTPEIKVSAVRGFGGNVLLHGTAFDEANRHAIELAKSTGATYIPPFDDVDVIAGQGTVAKELLTQNNQLNAVFIPVGGGGLLAGMAVYIKAVLPNVRVIGVEPDDAACLDAALKAGEPVTLDRVGLFADGVAVKRIGTETFKLAQLFCDEVVTVTSDEICAAIKDIFEDLRAVAEPAGALALAGLKKYAQQHSQTGDVNEQTQLAAVLSGANLNFDTLRYVSERCELGEKKEAVFAVTIPEEKGSFRRFCQTLGGRAITEFNYRYASDNKAHIFVGIKLRNGAQELAQVTQALTDAGYQFQDLSDDELAKLHVRHMVGGMPPRLVNEQVYQFNFPEYPGALMNFLNTLGEKWNITLFHYRNHGAATGDVLAGFEIADPAEIEGHLEALGYPYQLVSGNSSYRTFLTGEVGVSKRN
ncbi:threonine ammonia-lyase, biosynthetic [Rheinheimera texasensis]|uniref:threonine ammonia-lyase, biosynthetic n=1 Tax=Rheinheimera texasensis TaxID=306205 RepID=UPI0032B1DBC9